MAEHRISWNAPDRARRVADLIPGRSIPPCSAESLFLDWTRTQVERWSSAHPSDSPSTAFDRFAATPPTDSELTRDFPRHIAPFGRVRGAAASEPLHHLADRADQVFLKYCPLCGSFSFALEFDRNDPFGRATTVCCRTDLYARESDWPADSPHQPNSVVSFHHLDDTLREVPCTIYRDRDGTEWELFISTIFSHRRWIDQGCNLVREYLARFRESADPLYVHKIAIILDQVAETYYGLPLGAYNRLCTGKEGGPLTRAEWEAVSRPAIFEVSYLGPWSKRNPFASPGWLNMLDEHIWVEPFARTRHHPAFKEVSHRLYGDPEALDRKIMQKLLRELSLMFQSVFSQKLLHNYQEAIYIDLWLLGVLLQERVLIDFAAPCQELSMYNHTYQDGMNGEGAPNYQAMPGGYYFPVLESPEGWLEYEPDFLVRNPFFRAAKEEMTKSRTVRGVPMEWGDQHEHVYAPTFVTDADAVRRNELVGSRNWPGYGVGIIRVGGSGRRLEIGLAYTRASLHNAQDALSLECWVDGVPVMRRGGYAAWWCSTHLQWDRPEFQALRRMGYPHEIEEADSGGGDSWSWVWAHSSQNQNAITIDGIGTGRGWGDNRGYGECLTYKGGEPAGAPGSDFQVLEVVDHYSWSRVGITVSDFRRVIIGVDRPDGRPYALDLTHLCGGATHTLYNQAWAERLDTDLPPASESYADLSRALFCDGLPEGTPYFRNFEKIRNVERFDPGGSSYGVIWGQDYGAWGPRSEHDGSYVRPIPEECGKVRLRFIGVDSGDAGTAVYRGTGPWIGWLRQPLPGGGRVDGNVSFAEARDFFIEHREHVEGDAPLESTFLHILEGYREGDRSLISLVERLPIARNDDASKGIGTVALRITFNDGSADTVLYQPEAHIVTLPGDIRTDARFALLRRGASGAMETVHAVSVREFRCDAFERSLPGDFTGTIVDIVGDITGTRTESALVVRPDSPWPAGSLLQGRQINVRVESDFRAPCDEGYRVDAVTALDDGAIRVDLEDHAPFVVSWHEVTELPAGKSGVLRTWRPMADHGNSPWYRGLPVWFPERDRRYTIESVNEVGGGYGGDTLTLVEKVDLASEGIRPGDWYVIYAVRPGQRVRVANQLSWRQT